MRLIWIGQEQFIEYRGRAYAVNERSHDAICNLEWADKMLRNPCVTFQNGKASHEVANELIERCEDILLDYQVFF